MVGSPCARSAVARLYALCHEQEMQQGSRTRAGGCFLTIFILLGFFYGLATQNPLRGVLIGFGVGIIVAIVTWLIDARRRG